MRNIRLERRATQYSCMRRLELQHVCTKKFIVCTNHSGHGEYPQISAQPGFLHPNHHNMQLRDCLFEHRELRGSTGARNQPSGVWRYLIGYPVLSYFIGPSRVCATRL